MPLESESNLSALMEAAERGDSSAVDRLFTALYSELRRLARRELERQGLPITLGATSLLHQAYLEIADKDGTSFPDLARFMAYASRVMRGLIIDYARSRHAQKRGGLFEITSFETDSENAVDDRDLVQVSEALDELAKAEPQLCEIVDLKFFCGFTFTEIAAMRTVSERTVQRQWDRARIYLHRKIRAHLESC